MNIVPFSEISPPSETADPQPDRIVEGRPQAEVQSFFDSPDGRMSVGTWSCTPGRWRVRYEETEYCRVIEGQGAVIGSDGSVRTIRAGDEFVVPAGFEGEWLVQTPMRKRYVVLLL